MKRSADVVGIFPNEDSITCLIGAMIIEQNDEYQSQCRYMQLEGMSALATPQIEETTATDYTQSRLIDATRDHTRNYITLMDVTARVPCPAAVSPPSVSLRTLPDRARI